MLEKIQEKLGELSIQKESIIKDKNEAFTLLESVRVQIQEVEKLIANLQSQEAEIMEEENKLMVAKKIIEEYSVEVTE